MATLLAYRWWTFTARGVLALIFAAVFFLKPTARLEFSIHLFSCFWVLEGILSFWSGLRRKEISATGWVIPIFSGIFSLGMGILVYRRPPLNLFAFSYFVAFWSVVKGAFELTAAVQLQKIIRHEFFLALAGVVCVLFATDLILQPIRKIHTLELMLSSFLGIFGFLLGAVSFRLRQKLAQISKLIEIPEDYQPAA